MEPSQYSTYPREPHEPLHYPADNKCYVSVGESIAASIIDDPDDTVSNEQSLKHRIDVLVNDEWQEHEFDTKAASKVAEEVFHEHFTFAKDAFAGKYTEDEIDELVDGII